MPVVKPYPIGEAQARPLSGTIGERSGSLASFGPSQAPQYAWQDGTARDLAVAGAGLERASNNVAEIALGMAHDANEARVQDLNNNFIAAQQKLLYTDENAFYRKMGANAIEGAPTATQQLLDLKKSLIDQTGNQWQKDRLTRILDAHVNEATNGISRHVSVQSIEWQKQVAAGKQQLITDQARLDNNDMEKVDGLAAAAENNARAEAKIAGLSGTEAETASVARARSTVYGAAIDQALQTGDARRALAMYNNVKDRLDDRTNNRLSAGMKSIATQVEAENYIATKLPGGPFQPEVRKWGPQVQQAADRYGVDPVLALAVLKQESGGNPGAVNPKSGATGLMQIMEGTARDLGVTDRANPEQSINGGVKYLGQMIQRYGGNQRLGLMAYNWGPGNVDAWIKAGQNPDAVPAETRDYVKNVQGFVTAQQGVGYDKAAGEALIKTALDDPSISREVRASVTTMLQKQISTTEAARTATIKGLDDQLEAVTQLMILGQGKKGTLAQIADGYEAVGDKSKAINTRLLASQEDLLLNFSSAPREAQDIIKAMLQGKAKEFAGALTTATERDAAESTKAARDAFSTIKTAAENNIPLSSQTEAIKKAFDLAIKGKDRALVSEIHDWVNGRATAENLAQAPQAAITQLLGDMRETIKTTDQSAATITALDQFNKIQAAQKTALAQDAYAAGTTIYPQVGAPVPINWADSRENIAATIGIRAAQARQISQLAGMKAIPFSQQEIASIRNRLDSSAPDEQASIMRTLSAAPPDMLPGIAAALAGKQGEGDAVSRSYAAALAFYADKDPASQAAADQILKGSQIIRADGAGGRKPAVTADAWQQAFQDQIGSALQDVAPAQRQVVSDAIAAAYVYQMNRAGKQGEKTDTDVLNAAIKAVMGEPVKVNGQTLFPPQRGMTTYQFEQGVLGKLTDGDLQNARTLEGDPVTADLIRRRGVLTNVGDSTYKVRIPDPRRGGDLADVLMPDGRAFVIDGKAMLQRPGPAPAALPPQPGDPRRRAPASPTAGAEP